MTPGTPSIEDHQAIAELLHLLGRAWLLEPDREMLDRLAVLPALRDSAENITEEAAAIEYSTVLLQVVPPYASLFLHESGMLNAAPAEEAQRAYLEGGFEIDPAWRAGAADHLGLHLLFLAHLLAHGSAGWRGHLSRKILNWAPVCCLAVARVGDSRRYAPLATFT
ncbi:MAG: molecular chaperone TorD family protein, partial [Chloroflexota bacterium]